MRSLGLEFVKLRRKHVPVVVLALVGAVLAWLCMDAHAEGSGSSTGWGSLLYAVPIMNAIFLSLLSTVVASRVVDVDHEACAWKQLLCLQETGSLLSAKFACATLVMAGAVALELAGIMVIGLVWKFPGPPSLGSWAALALSQLVASLCMLVLVGTLALMCENQFVAVASGLTLSLAGLFSGFLPTALQRLVPSGYYTLLATVRVDWAAESGVPRFYETSLPFGDYALIAAISVAASVYACRSFGRKEA